MTNATELNNYRRALERTGTYTAEVRDFLVSIYEIAPDVATWARKRIEAGWSPNAVTCEFTRLAAIARP